MTETDISKVLIEGDYATIMGIRYKRVEEPKSIRAEQVWEAFKGELIVEPTEDMRQALATAIRVVADRLCTDWGELQHPYDVLNEIADEVDSLVDKPKDDFMDEMVAELKGQNLTDILYLWWSDVFTTHSDWDMETSIDDLVTRIEEWWLPKEQSAAGSQNAYVECSVEGFNDCLKKIKGKLR